MRGSRAWFYSAKTAVGAVTATIKQTKFVADVRKPTVEAIQLLLRPGEPTADDVLAAVEKFWADKGAKARIMINYSNGTTRPFNSAGVGEDHFVLLHADRGSYFGTRPAGVKPRQNREGKTYPYADNHHVYTGPPRNYFRPERSSFPAAPASYVEQHHVRNKQTESYVRDEQYGGKLSQMSEAEKDARVKGIVGHLESQFKDVPRKEDDTNPPAKYAADYLTGWPTLFLQSPMNPELDAALPFAVAHVVLQYHSVSNTAVMSSFLNFAKGGMTFPAEIALISELSRVLKDGEMSWLERKSRIDWLATALDNMAIIKRRCGFEESTHKKRRAYWAGLSDEERRDILKAICEGEVTGSLRQSLEEALSNSEHLLQMRDRNYTGYVSEDGEKRIREDCLRISESHGLSRRDFEEYLLFDGTPCPFHVTNHAALRRMGYNFKELCAWMRTSPFHRQCNKRADKLKLFERDIDIYWERLLYDVWQDVSRQARAAIDRVALLRPSLSPSDLEFREEVKYLILDRKNLPISPFLHHSLQLVVATKGPPNTAMFTGYAERKDGRLPTEGPVSHPEPFDLVLSFDKDINNTSADARWTNNIMGSHDPSFWPWLFAILSQIPFEGPYRKISEELGRVRLDQPGAQPSDARAPDPSYRGVEVPVPPYGELLGAKDDPVQFSCSACPGRGFTELTAGAFQEHLNKEHSVWVLECRGCGLKFSDKEAEAAHRDMNACLGKEGLLGEAASALLFSPVLPARWLRPWPCFRPPFSCTESS
ncbi:hypothetical protein F5883DRAFT_674611 [Diaporthe sp. PMI_573]|nr:hypothetical protein F5883DRAFT_674611 [Diaporthaceae sp. PMI_573]